MMKNLLSLVLLTLVACSGDIPPADVPQPVLEGLTADTAKELTSARDAVLLHPDDATRAGHYGMLLHAYRQEKIAAVMYERASQLAPEEYRWSYYHAYLLESLGDPDAAVTAYGEALRINLNYSPGHLRMANLLLSQGRESEARDQYLAILKTNPGFTPAAVGLGQAFIAMNNETAAQKVFDQVLLQDSTNAKAHYGLAQIQRSLGDTVAATEHLRLFEQFRSVQRLSPDRLLSEIGELNKSDRPSMQRARNSLSRGDVQGAIAHFEQAIERNPDNTGARVSLVGLYSAVNDFASAEKRYNEALPLVPDNAKLHFNFGFSQQRRGLHSAAIQIFGRALSLNPDDADSLAYLGVSQLTTGERDAALASFQRAVTLNPQQREGNARLGQVLLENGDAKNAVQYLTTATRRDDQYSITYLILLADALNKLNKAVEADKARQRALGLARRFNDARAETLADGNS